MTGFGQSSGTGAATLPLAEDLERVIARLTTGDTSERDDAERIDLLRTLERLSCVVQAAQSVVTADFDASQRAKAAAAGVPTERQGRGIAAQVALARRESPRRGEQHLGLARILRTEMPRTQAAFRAGHITEWRATVVARETACLALQHRRLIDAEIAGSPTSVKSLEAMSDGEVIAAIRKRACELDPASVAERRRRAESERRTSLRPAPDTMTWFGALLPVKDGVAVHTALRREADRLNAQGDPRGRGQIMADTLVQRVLAPHLAAVERGAELPLMIDLVVSDGVLLGDDHGAGHVQGYGPIPGDLIREWIAGRLDDGSDLWLRRLYATPATGDLVAMDSKARTFTGKLAEFLRLRDHSCRTPWCDAPIRHLDHAVDHAHGGPTSATNGQGLCQACNHAKQARGWTARPRPGPRHTIETTTPTGHRHRSSAPALTSPHRIKIELYHPHIELVLAC